MAHTVVIGGNVDALVAAHLLARTGQSVVVLDPLDGANDAPTVAGWIPPAIVQDLRLESTGLRIERPDPWLVAPLPDGRRLELFQDLMRSVASIRQVSERDAARWPDFCERMARLAHVLESIYAAAPPDPLSEDRRELWRMGRQAWQVRRAGGQAVLDLMRIVPMPIADLLDDWFESDTLKGLLGAVGVRFQRQGPRSSGTAYGLLHRHVGSASGVFDSPRSNIAAILRTRPGIELRRKAPVARIEIRDGAVAAVVLANGEAIQTNRVLSAEHPRRALIEQIDTKWIDPALQRSIRGIRARGVTARVHALLRSAPDVASMVIAPSLDYIQRAHDDAKYGRISGDPWLEIRAGESGPAGSHRARILVQCAPYALRDASWDDDQHITLGHRVAAVLARHLPALGATVESLEVESPPDLAATQGWEEGQPYDVELALDQWLWMRPTPALAQYRTPIRGLYLCGPGMHPGGGLGGAAGANAARIAISEA